MLNKQQNNLQDIFLNGARKSKMLVSIYLTNGFLLKGLVKGFDNFTVYKHAITTISPNKPILFAEGNEYGKEDEG